MAPVYKVAVCQFDPKVMDLEANFQTAKRQISDAAAGGAHLAVLPEFHLTSWVPEQEGFLDASRESNSYLLKYQVLARELGINIVPGTICEPWPLVTGAIEWHNMAYFIAADTGDICGSYQKKNLWHTERQHLTSSRFEPHLAFDTPLRHADGRPVRAGLLICWDLAFPEAFRALVTDGADLIIIPSWWYPLEADKGLQEEGININKESERVFMESATTLRAFEGGVAVIFCNAGGCSGVTMPVLGEATRCGDQEEMRIAEIDLDVLRVAEGIYKVRQDLGSVDWHYGYERK